MVTSSTLVGSSSTSFLGLDQRTRHGQALALAAGKLVRIALQRAGNCSPSQRSAPEHLLAARLR